MNLSLAPLSCGRLKLLRQLKQAYWSGIPTIFIVKANVGVQRPSKAQLLAIRWNDLLCDLVIALFLSLDDSYNVIVLLTGNNVLKQKLLGLFVILNMNSPTRSLVDICSVDGFFVSRNAMKPCFGKAGALVAVIVFTYG
jgi:hypothetical protein